eukprot:6967215-Karenia_brevis.AAC.1
MAWFLMGASGAQAACVDSLGLHTFSLPGVGVGGVVYWRAPWGIVGVVVHPLAIEIGDTWRLARTT